MPGRTLFAVIGLLAGLAVPTSAQQPLAVTGAQGIAFGLLLPGLPTSISRLDRANAGQFEIRGERRLEVLVQLLLPTDMQTGAGAMLPLTFGTDDAGWSENRSIGNAQGFDPGTPLIATLSNSGRLFVFLGGTASPAPQQAGGDYAATIVLTVTYTGN